MDGGDVWVYLFFFSLVILGMRRMWTTFDSGDKVKSAAQGWLISWLKR